MRIALRIAYLSSCLFSWTSPAQGEEPPCSCPSEAELVDADRIRIRAHLASVERELRARDVSHLTAAQQERRAQAMDNLHRYAEAGVFPRNRTDRPITPVFIDPDGRTCAMAQLLVDSGSGDLAREIADGQNLARVPEIRSEALERWLEDNGIRIDEATWIQPTYRGNCCPHSLDSQPDVCGEDGVTYIHQCAAEECETQFSHEGPCQPGAQVETCGCSEDEAPMCTLAGGPGLPGRTGGWLGVAIVGLGIAGLRRRYRSPKQ